MDHTYLVLTICLTQYLHVSAAKPLPMTWDMSKRDLVYNSSSLYSEGAFGLAPNQTFKTVAGNPPSWNFLRTPNSADQLQDGCIFLGINSAVGTSSGLVILDNNGDLIYWGPEFGQSMHFRPQSYQGQQVLTFYGGDFFSGGYGNGTNYMMDSTYTIIDNVTCLNQTADTSDFHEFRITEGDTGLVESWRLAEIDLSPLGGPSNGWTWDCVFQEVDIASKELLFEWRSLEHVPLNETYFEISANAGHSSSNPFDYCHINSVEKDSYGHYIVSMRGPSAVYNISGTGDIVWRLGGKLSDFEMGPNATFYYQHDARIHDNGTTITIFDNAGTDGYPAEPAARGIELALDTDAMTATLIREWLSPFNNISGSQGSLELLDNGNALVGWGSEPYFTEFTGDGQILWNVEFASEGVSSAVVDSYRAYKGVWYGFPQTRPNISVETSGNEIDIYVSWNGATNISSWAVMGGSDSTTLSPVLNGTKNGFETMLSLTSASAPAFISVAALDASGSCIGVSQVWQIAENVNISTVGTCPDGSAPSTQNTAGRTSNAAEEVSDTNGAGGTVIPVFSAMVLLTIATGILVVL